VSQFKSDNAKNLVRASVAAALGTAIVWSYVPHVVAAEEQAEEIEEVKVTGSRILRRDFDSSSPIVTIGSEQLTQTSNIALEANLNKLPQFVPALSQLVTGEIQPSATTTPGQATVNLRGLGANRNLVIVDGRRAMPVNATLTIDLNSIPSAAIDRVEIITGGASSTYGADAVGGVVNFIVKKNFEGMQVDGQYGVSQEGDAEESRISALIGGNFGDGRGNVMFGGEYSKRGSAYLVDRPFYKKRYMDPTVSGTDFWWTETGYNSGFANTPSQTAINAIFTAVPAGSSVSPFGTDFYLNDDGSLYAGGLGIGSIGAGFGGGTNQSGTYRYNGGIDGVFRKRGADGQLHQNDTGAYVSTPLERHSFFGRGSFEFNDSLTAFVQGTLAQNSVDTKSQFSPGIFGWNASIPHGTGRNCQSIGITNGVCDDARLPAAATMPTLAAYLPGGSAGLTNCPAVGGCTNTQAFPVPAELLSLLESRGDRNGVWSLDEVFDWLPARSTSNNSTTFQLVAGLEGKLPVKDWTWEGYVSHGQSATSTQINGVVSLDSWRTLVTSPNYGRGFVQRQNSGEIINGIPMDGGGFGGARVTCTSGLPIVANFAVSQDCVDALSHSLQNRQRIDQTVYEANLQGGLVDTWAGEARFAAGVSRRVNSFVYQTDGLTSINNFLDSAVGIFPLGDSAGRTAVNEIYGETLIPVLGDLPFAKRVELELGYRYSDYNPSGGESTYKALADWTVNDYLRIRGGRQSASRAPNIGELYSGKTQSFGGTPPSQDLCSPLSTFAFSANPTTNPTGAAAARTLCNTMMGAAGANQYYVVSPQTTAGGGGLYQTQGNPTVQAETANTWTVGFVAGLPSENPLLAGLRLTMDWYQISLKDAITSTNGDVIMERCFDPSQNVGLSATNIWCQALQRNPDNGTVSVVNALFSNEAAYKTSGYDVQIDWRASLADMGFSSAPGSLSMNIQATILDKFQEKLTATSPVRDWKGYEGPNLTGIGAGGGGSFDYRVFTTVTYNTGKFGVTLRHRYTPSIKAAGELTSPTAADGVVTAKTPSYNIFDLSGTWAINSMLTARAGIDNFFNNDPPITGRNTISATGMTGGSLTTSGGGIYDPLGRRFYLGLSAKF
jgi:outer membrane receptor protein involved in Fe transport